MGQFSRTYFDTALGNCYPIDMRGFLKHSVMLSLVVGSLALMLMSRALVVQVSFFVIAFAFFAIYVHELYAQAQLRKKQNQQERQEEAPIEVRQVEGDELLPAPEVMTSEDLHEIAERILGEPNEMAEKIVDAREVRPQFVEFIAIGESVVQESDFTQFDSLIEREILSDRHVLVLSNFTDHRHIEDTLSLSLLARGRVEQHFCRNIRGAVDLVPHTGPMKPIREKSMYRFLHECVGQYERIIIHMREEERASWQGLMDRINGESNVTSTPAPSEEASSRDLMQL